eukprot:g74402.t1
MDPELRHIFRKLLVLQRQALISLLAGSSETSSDKPLGWSRVPADLSNGFVLGKCMHNPLIPDLFGDGRPSQSRQNKIHDTFTFNDS